MDKGHVSLQMNSLEGASSWQVPLLSSSFKEGLLVRHTIVVAVVVFLRVYANLIFLEKGLSWK